MSPEPPAPSFSDIIHKRSFRSEKLFEYFDSLNDRMNM